MKSQAEGAPAEMLASRQLAAIDLGSNSFRLEIGQVIDGRYRRIDYLKETVRLGAGLDGEGMLSEEAAERGLACLGRFAARLQGVADRDVRAVATQTLREAKNRDAFLARAEARLGRSIEVISGREEARLIYAGVARLQPSVKRRLVVDIGGRSTELILGTGLKVAHAESFAVGSVSLSMRYFARGVFDADSFAEAEIAAGAEFEEANRAFLRHGWDEALGSSGTVGAVAQILEANGIDGTVTPQGLRRLIERCIAAGDAESLRIAGLKDDRRPVLAGGLAILSALASGFRIASLAPARGALRQGVVFEMLARDQVRSHADGAEDVRDESVLALQRRFAVDEVHAGRVRKVAAALFAQASGDASNGSADELRWAAALHEVGKVVSAHDFHRHAAYLVGHADAPGFSQSQLRRIAELVLAQRGGLRKVERLLQDRDRQLLVLCLRLALVVCHAREPCDESALALRVGGETATIAPSSRWAAANPRGVHLLEAEAQAWDKAGSAALQVRLAEPTAAGRGEAQAPAAQKT